MRSTGKNGTMTATSTVQLMPGDIMLNKADAFQGKRKVRGQCSKMEYVAVL